MRKSHGENIYGKAGYLRLGAAVMIFILTLGFVLPYAGNVPSALAAVLANVSSPAEVDSLIKNLTSNNTSVSVPAAETQSERSVPPLEEETAETNAAPRQNADNSSGYITPDDIAGMESEYISSHEAALVSGTVTDSTITSKGATDIIGNVAVRNTTSTKKPDFAAELEKGADLEIGDLSQPLVLIFHTHTTESYLLADNGVFYSDFSTRSFSPDRNMIRVGDEICSMLENNGIKTIHDTNVYDESYNGAYARSRKTVEQYLADYPSIKIVLDVHRDAVYYSDSERGKFTCTVDGKKAAQIMIITGAEEGLVTSFPEWEYNLRFALALQKQTSGMYDGLMKPIYFCQRRYNMDTARCSLLLEIGSDANTLDEAVYSAHLLGQGLAQLILGAVK